MTRPRRGLGPSLRDRSAQLTLRNRGRIVGFTERLADHPVGVQVDLPLIVAAARADTEQRTGRRELQQVHDRRRFGTFGMADRRLFGMRLASR